MKTCTKCGIEKDESEFYKDKNGKNGLRSTCIYCMRKYEYINMEYIKAQKKKYREDNKERIKNQQKKYREDNKEHIKKIKKRHVEDNKERYKEKCKERWKNGDKEKCKERAKKYYEDNKYHLRKYAREYARENKDVVKKRCDSLQDSIIIQYFKKQNEWMQQEDITPEMIEIKRLQIKIKREIKNQMK